MQKFTRGQEVIVVVRRGYGEDMTLTGLRGTVVSGGTKNVTVAYVEHDAQRRDSFDIETGVLNGRYSGGKTVYTLGQWARFQAAQDVEGNFEIADEASVRTRILTVSVHNRDSIWFETIGCEFEPRTVRLAFSQHNGSSIQLDEISLLGPKLNEDTLRPMEDSPDVIITRNPECYRADLRHEYSAGRASRNSLPEWAWVVAEKVWPNTSVL